MKYDEIMKLEEAITHCERRADFTRCGRGHKQLAEWLKELKHYRQKEHEKRRARKEILDRLRNKLNTGQMTNAECAYNEGILSAMSIVSAIIKKG